MIIRSRAPLRLGLAGGGTDTSPYADRYGGAVLNATISMYVYSTLQQTTNKKIVLDSFDLKLKATSASSKTLKLDGNLDLIKGVYNRIVKDNKLFPLSFNLTTYSDAPAGVGLGTSSTVAVTVLGAFVELLKLPFGEYDIAHLAYEIERKDLKMIGGRQDQYAATFGGFNFMEFYSDDKVIVNPLRVKAEHINELEHNLLLYYTGTTRPSSGVASKIIESQSKGINNRSLKPLEAMHKLKEQAIMMKEALLKGNIDQIGEILNYGWQYKKNLAKGVSNPMIDELYETAVKAGSTGGKITGAGGGGFMMLYCPGNTRYRVISALEKFGGAFKRYQFTSQGLQTWTTNLK